jgi:hypothetical protein
MNDTLVIIIIIIIVYELQTNTVYEYFTTENLVSSVDQRSYKIVGGYANKRDAANKMAELNEFIISLLKFIKQKYIINRSGNILEQEYVGRVLKNYNPDVIFENNPKQGEDTSFVVNKGSQFAICLRNKINNRIHGNNILQFVMIHELSHLGTITFGHDYSFWSWFKFMLVQASLSGLYTPVNYSEKNTSYCGIDVTYNPYFGNTYNWLSPQANP